MGKTAAVSGFSEKINAVWFSLNFLRGGGGVGGGEEENVCQISG